MSNRANAHNHNRQSRRIRARREFRMANAADDEEGVDEAAEFLARLKRARETRKAAVQRFDREPFEADDDSGRNDECPCGSGYKYKGCCL